LYVELRLSSLGGVRIARRRTCSFGVTLVGSRAVL
jgi:hypothetical protein